jgi:putative transposase
MSARMLNQIQDQKGRKVWHQYWDTQLTFEKSYLARLNYVMQNPVKHGLMDHAENYPWCSIRGFIDNVTTARRATVESFKIDKIEIADDY